MAKVKVLIVDDSAVMRKVLTSILSSDPGIEVVGSAMDPIIARDKIKQLQPDVITLDVEMPRMDGLTFLRNLMRLRPMPVVMISTLTEKGAETTLNALEIGAVDFVAKPKVDVANSIEQYAEEIIAKVLAASHARVRAYRGDAVTPGGTPQDFGDQLQRLKTTPCLSVDAVVPKRISGSPRVGEAGKIIAIGASTGGTEAIKEVLIRLPVDMPPIVVTQHIPPKFSTMFAQRMNTLMPLTVCEAADNQPIEPGHVYIAPGDRHLLVERTGGRYLCRLSDGPPVNRHKPSVDVLFRSVADTVGPNAIGVILTGMGADGAVGLKEMRDRGSPTIAQDEETSVVWGMPGEAVKRNGAEKILPLQNVAAEIMRMLAGIR
jgi:two-component system chemotaxis response regulator CheB